MAIRPEGTTSDRLATRDVLLFTALCLVWGLTWIPIKIGTAAVPPLLFAAARFLAAGMTLVVVSWVVGKVDLPQRKAIPKLLLIAILTVTLAYGPLFWGAARLTSGLAAVINLSLIPIGLMAAEALFERRRPKLRQVIACTVGLPGLVILFLGDGTGSVRLEGILAVVVGTIAYCTGSVLSRRIPTQPSPATVSAFCNTVGALLLGVWAIATQETNALNLAAVDELVVGAWLYLVVFGSIFGFTTYLYLLRAWGAGRAGTYAFLSPIVAVIAGAVALSETVTAKDSLGMGLMLMGAMIALWSHPMRSDQAKRKVATTNTRRRS